MAATENNLPWSDETDQFISNIDRQIVQTYGVSLREVLLYPEKFANTKDINKKLDDMKKDIDAYFDKMREGMKDQEDEFEKALEFADAQFTKIDGIVATKASLSRVPYMKPVYVDSDSSKSEEIFIDQYNNGLDALLTKLVNISNYIANVSNTYKKYTLGSWLFSGQRNYIITVSTPNSPVLMIDRLNNEIGNLVDSAYDRIKISKAK